MFLMIKKILIRGWNLARGKKIEMFGIFFFFSFYGLIQAEVGGRTINFQLQWPWDRVLMKLGVQLQPQHGLFAQIKRSQRRLELSPDYEAVRDAGKGAGFGRFPPFPQPCQGL